MYDQFYNLRSEPFRLSPDHAFAYAHKGYQKARAYMAYAFMREEGFVMITGRPGTGKTTLIGALIEHLGREDVKVANLVCSQLRADDLLKMVAYDFGIPLNIVEKGELLQRMTVQLRSWRRDGRRALLIVDEAQNLAVTAMEELRLLTNIQVDGRPLLQIFLLGQPELRELMLRPELEQVHQRIVAASHLRPLQLEETEAYVRHRMEVVGWSGDPAFHPAVFPLVHKFSEGIPRRINLICSRLLLHCALEQRHRVEVADVREVILELQEENLAVGSGWTEADFAEADAAEPQGAAPEAEPPAPAEPVKPPEAATQAEAPGSEDDMPAPPATPTPEAVLPPTVGSITAPLGSATPAPGQGRQHLKVVAAGPVAVQARRTGTYDGEPDDRELEAATPLAEVGIIELEPAPAPEIPAPPRLRARGPQRPAAPGRPPAGAKSVGKVAKPASKSTAPAGEADASARAEPSVRDYTGAWAIGVIFLVSAALVVWAISGFSLGLFWR